MLVGAVGRRVAASAAGSVLFVASVFAVSLAVAAVAGSQSATATFACSASGPTYTVRSGDGWLAIADRSEISVGSLLEANGAELNDLLVPGDRLCLPRGAGPANRCGSSYSVRRGDSWYAIAERSGVSPSSLLAVNDAELDSLLVPDQRICLPRGAELPATSPSDTAATASAKAVASGRTAPTYTVRPGEGWFVIADRVQVRAAALIAANDAELGDIIFPGQQLRLPAGAVLPATPEPAAPVTSATYTVRPGEGWFVIADRVQVRPAALLDANDAELGDIIVPGQELRLPAGAVVPERAKPSTPKPTATYTVRPGEGWFVIADRVQVRPAALLDANDAELSDIIVPGQELRLPAGAVVPERPDPDAPVRIRLEALPTQGPCWFHDTWHDARSGGRRHVGVDIFTVPGEYVYAVADGRLTGRAWDQPDRRSGNAWYLTADSGHRFFYAHLSDFAPGLEVGSRVRAGQIIGWVGATGNTSYPHLHFEVHPWGGEPINPYPMVRTQGGCNRGTPYTQPGGWVPD